MLNYFPDKDSPKESAKELAELIEPSGIPNTDYMVEYGTHRVDTDLVRSFLKDNGQDANIFPGTENCYPIIQSTRAILNQVMPKLTKHKLELLFPIFFQKSALVGRNHVALCDARQLRLVMMDVLVPFCKPPGQREFDQSVLDSVESFFRKAATPSTQTTLESWLSKDHPPIKESSEDSDDETDIDGSDDETEIDGSDDETDIVGSDE